MRQRGFAVEAVHRKSGHEKDAAPRHRLEQLGFLVQVTAVLNRIDARLDRGAQTTAAERMTHHTPVEGMCLVGERLHLVGIECAVLRPMLWHSVACLPASLLIFNYTIPRHEHPPTTSLQTLISSISK